MPRPKTTKSKQTVSELQEITKLQKEVQQLQKDIIKSQSTFKWDAPISAQLDFFDANLSYELTGYKPIDSTRGLDFDPKWFIEARETFENTGSYCTHLPGSKKYREFWTEQYKRCKYGYTVNGYTVTGFHYFFLNFYTLPLVHKVTVAGSGRPEGFPDFTVAQYIWFHYLDYCCKMLKNAALMKSRGIGFSEINASITATEFTIIRESMSIITCHDESKTKRTLRKAWHALAFLDKNTQGGMSKNKQIKNTDMEKTSGAYIMKNGTKIQDGWQSTIQGIVADDPQKIRGDRADFMIFDEAGSWPGLETALIQGEALLTLGGKKFGIGILGGTGGDKGANLEGLRKIYYDPRAYGVMPYRHRFTETGEEVETGFFIPAYQQIYDTMDSRGYCEPEASKAILLKAREAKLGIPSAYIAHCAEYCWTAEEAFALEGENKFNKALIAEQLTNIRLHKLGPKPESGNLTYIFKSNKAELNEIMGFSWKPDMKSKLRILEHPIWSKLYVRQQEKEDDEEITQYQEMQDLYIAGIDGIDIGKAQTSSSTKDPSDFCIVIMKRAMGTHPAEIVAVYKDRPQDITTAYKIALCLLKYYNAKANVEATRVGFINWMKTAKQMQYLVRRPRATLADVKTGNTKAYGTPATPTIIDMQTDLIATWIENNWMNIWFEDILEELQKYNDENKRKFDIVASLGMVMLLEQELSSRVPTKVDKYDEEEYVDFGYWIDDKGYKHFGIIPKAENDKIRFGGEEVTAYDPYSVESSDPRNNPRLYRW